MPESPPGGDDEDDVAELDDPESAPAIPAAAVAARAAALRRVDTRATDREIWRLAWPVILSQILASTVSLIDIAMLGRLGPSSLAAVGYVTQIFLLSQAVLFAIGVAGVALMSRAIGAGDPARARAALAGCLVVAVAVAALLAGFVLSFPRALLGLLNAKPDVIEAALPYLRFTMTLDAALRGFDHARVRLPCDPRHAHAARRRGGGDVGEDRAQLRAHLRPLRSRRSWVSRARASRRSAHRPLRYCCSRSPRGDAPRARRSHSYRATSPQRARTSARSRASRRPPCWSGWS